MTKISIFSGFMSFQRYFKLKPSLMITGFQQILLKESVFTMNDIGRKILKQLAETLKNTTNNKVLLFTKDVSDMVDKLTQSKIDDKSVQSESNETTPKYPNDTHKQDEKPSQPAPDDSKPISSKQLKETISFNAPDKTIIERSNQTNASSVNMRTTIIIDSIKSSSSTSSLLKRLEILNTHLKKFPEGTPFAYRIETQNILIKLKNKTKDPAIHQIANETLSLIGYCDPPSSSGVRVLSIDGGGMRGLVVINVLQQLEILSGKRIHQLFDYICGVSTGAVITCCSVPPITLHLEKLRDLYLELGRQIFKQNALKGASKLVFSCAYYETSVWEHLLKEQVGSTTLLETTRNPQCPKICVISTVGNRLRVTPFVFRNYSPPQEDVSNYLGSCAHTVFEAMRASAAAPSVFEEFKSGEHSHLDGGIVANNPAGVAVHEVKALWPEEDISCLVSCGTGRNPQEHEQSKKSTSWKRILDKVLESATDTEAVHTILNDLLADNVYFRFNPILTNPFAIDEISDDKVELLEKDIYEYCKRNEEKLSAVVSKLMEPRSFLHKCKDHIKMKIKLSES